MFFLYFAIFCFIFDQTFIFRLYQSTIIMLKRCWAPCFTLNSGYLALEKGSKLIAYYTATLHIVFLFYGIYLLMGGQSDAFFSPFFEFSRKDTNILAFLFIAYCIFYLIFCSIGLIHAIHTVICSLICKEKQN